MEKIQFSNLPISAEVKRAVSEMGFEEATAIQSQSIPLILEGNDVMGHSQTGTGKTAAFGIPIIERISEELKGKTQALVLCPTRELAIQACEEMRKFAKFKQGIRVVPVYGGQPIDRQINTLKNGAEIVIGTPGRVMDHLRRHTLKFEHLSMIVLDEADEMLNMGFREDIETILKDIPQERQTILFSATMPPAILQITKEYQKDPKMVKIEHHKLTMPKIQQYYYEIPKDKKTEALALLLDYHNPNRSIIFCNTKRMVDELASELQFRGFSVDGLHGDMKQQSRTLVMNSFKSGKIDILIATDVAARGIDVDDIEAVFNYDLPQDEEYYVHRIGRTGRAGKMGESYTFVSGRRQIYALRDIAKYTKSKIELRTLPTYNEVQEMRNDSVISKITEVLKKDNFRKNEIIVDKLIESDFNTVEIACAALQLLMENENEHISSESIVSSIKDSRRDSNRDSQKGMKGTLRKDSKRDSNKDAQKDSKKDAKPERRKSGNNKDSMTRLIINVGKKDNVSPRNISAAISSGSGLTGRDIGDIDVYDKFSFVEVPKAAVEFVLQSVNGTQIKGRTSSIEVVKNKKRRRTK